MSDSAQTIRRRHGRYPWNEWFKRFPLALRRGEDFTCQPHGMAQMARNQASARGLAVKVTVGEDGLIKVTRKESNGAKD